MGSNSTINQAIQVAIWHVFDGLGLTALASNPLSPNALLQTDSRYWYNLAVSDATTLNSITKYGKYIEILTPLNGSAGHAISQEFIVVVTPEPASYAMLGTGLMLLSLLTFRRRRMRTN
jgi:hypothetical protein